jgi:hypothetical protein
MKLVIVLLLLIGSATSQVTHSAQTSDGLRVEVRVSSGRVQMTGEIALSVFFRSPGKEITIWNALAWGAPAGLYLRVLDSSGHELRNNFHPFYHPLPPDLTGRGALISIGEDTFAGFDSRIPAKMLFPGPGTYMVKCIYSQPLPRNYFKGMTIWGKEDGTIESLEVPVSVDE